MKRHRLFALLLLLIGRGYAAAQPPSIEDLGTLDPATPGSAANGVSANGAVVVGNSTVAGNEHAFRWTSAGGMVDLGTLVGAGGTSTALDASDDGQVVVGSSLTGSGFDHAFRWTSAGMVDLGTIDAVPGGSQAHAVSANGSVVVGDSDNTAGGTHAFSWTSAGGMVDLGSFAGAAGFSTAQGVSDNGAVVAGYSFAPASSERRLAFRWQGGVSEDISAPGKLISAVTALAGDGRFMAGIVSDLPPVAGFRASLWTPDIVGQQLPALGTSVANDISADGGVVVGTTVLEGQSSTQFLEATVWIDGMPHALAQLLAAEGVDLSDWADLSFVNGISANGRVVVGEGILLASGDQSAFRAVLPNRGPTIQPIKVVSFTRLANGNARVKLSAKMIDPDSAPLTARWRVDGAVRKTHIRDPGTTTFIFSYEPGDTPLVLTVTDGDKTARIEGIVRVTETRVRFIAEESSAVEAASEESSLAANGSSLDAYRLSGLAVGSETSAASLSGYRYAESAILAELYADEANGSGDLDAAIAYGQLRFAQAAYSQVAADEHLRAFAETGDEAQLFAAVRWQMSAGEALQALTD